jgi:hypothetical protein
MAAPSLITIWSALRDGGMKGGSFEGSSARRSLLNTTISSLTRVCTRRIRPSAAIPQPCERPWHSLVDRAFGKLVSAACRFFSSTWPRSLKDSRATPLSALHVRPSRAASLHVSSGIRWSSHTAKGRAVVGKG